CTPAPAARARRQGRSRSGAGWSEVDSYRVSGRHARPDPVEGRAADARGSTSSPRAVYIDPAVVIVLALLSASDGACARREQPTPAAARNLLFVTIDTLRADHVGAYGAKNVATPNIDRIAREGALARHADVQVPLTRPSHITIFSGRYPAEHGIRDNVAPALRTDVPLM